MASLSTMKEQSECSSVVWVVKTPYDPNISTDQVGNMWIVLL